MIRFSFIMSLLFFSFSQLTQAAPPPKKEVIAAILIGEAGGEKSPGMQAVLNVMQNRTKQPNSATSIYYVATKKWQFSAYNRVSVSKKWTEAKMVAYFRRHVNYKKAYQLIYHLNHGNIDDVTGGATHFYNPDKVKTAPSWAPVKFGGKNKKAKFTVQIGSHLFFKDVD